MPNLVGTGLNQVPTNSMLGGLAYQDPEHASIKDLDLKNLSQINSEIADTAVDVFVYDTRKDSDGGAWRKRTQHTSWYNETLNTATRGSRKEFPAVAVIVAETTKVTIYDGDDPDLPMWMVFTWSGNVDNLLGYSNRAKSAITAVNGYLITCGDPDGIHIARFVHDDGIRYTHVNHVYTSDSIANRTNTIYRMISNNGPQLLVAATCNDITATVLPNAPIDDATGLPIPTIAVGTDSGVSVIRDDNIVISTSGSSHIHKVEFTDDHGLNAIISNTGGANWACVYVNDIDTLDGLNFATYNNWDGVVYRTKYDPKALTYKTASINDTISRFIDLENRSSAISVSAIGGGLTLLEKSPKESFDPDGGMVDFIATDYNTGWMQGDIQGAFLSDTDDTNAIEYVQNGYFNSDVSSWTIGTTGTTATLNANRLLLTAPSSGSSWGYVYQGVTTEIGKTYKISLKYDRGTVDGRIVVRNDSTNTVAGALFYEDLGTSADGKTYFNTFTATATTTYILLYSKSTSGGTNAYDEVSVTLEKDRSVNNRGLNVIGTITKQPVATGADLVAYSGFSSSNRLDNRGDYDFGVGDSVSMCIIGWFKTTNISSYAYIMSVYDSGTDQVAGLAINGSSAGGANPPGTLYVYDSVTTQTSGTITVNDGAWHCAVGVFDGSNRKIYLDGKLQVSKTFTSFGLDIADTDKLTVGRYAYNDSYNFLGSLALTRISKSIPSAEQIKKIYEDEKVLFQENAKCTLYGSSDAVTTLAYDDSTNLLYTGTSAGRSEFQGLRRINNTTTAVTTAISASNGLVAEQ